MKYKKIISVKLPTSKGYFQLIAYQNGNPDKYHLALVRGNLKGKSNVFVRMHSSCITGDIFGSQRCDCGQQLNKAIDLISQKENGVILYLFQEGRGIGLINKLRAYKLQEQGLDTVEANLKLGLPADQRNYLPAAEILKDMGIVSVKLLTNNPDKVRKLKQLGIQVERVPWEIEPLAHNSIYLATKKAKMGHLLSLVN